MENLVKLAELDTEQLMANASPALRAALERHTRQSRANIFQSFISARK